MQREWGLEASNHGYNFFFFTISFSFNAFYCSFFLFVFFLLEETMGKNNKDVVDH